MFAVLSLLVACRSDDRELPSLPELPPKLVSTAPVPGPVAPLRELLLAVTGAVRGEIEVCGCPTTPYGGFARRTKLFENLRDTGVPLFAADAGEMLVKGLTAHDDADRRVRAEAVLDLAETAGLDAWAASPVDLRPGGIELLAARGALAASWPQTPLAPARLVMHDGVTLGFVGLPAPQEGQATLDVVGAVKAAMVGTADAWFVLSNAGEAANLLVAEGVPGLAAVLTTEGERYDEPKPTLGAPIIEAPSRGRYIALLHLSLATPPRALELADRGVWKDVALMRTARSAAALPAAKEAMAVEAEREHLALEKATAGRAVVYVETLPLSPDLDGDDSTNARLSAFKQDLLGAAAKSSSATSTSGYAPGTCGSCHHDRIASWAFDKHARAVESLQKRQAADNPECVGCHSTGFGRPGGFAAVDGPNLEAFRDVQCEASHGPMRGHDGHNGVRSTPVSEATCLGCHDGANSPKFEYQSYLARISCTRVAQQGKADPSP